VDTSDFVLQSVPPDGPRPLLLVRIKAHRMNPYYFTILSMEFFGPRVHWTGERTSPCFKAREKCPGCKLKAPGKWLGYLHCLDEHGKECLLELTNRAAKMLLASVPKNRVLRGLKISVQRTEGGKHGRLCATCCGVVPNQQALPAPKDPLHTLLYLWGLKEDLDEPWSELLA